MFILYVTFTAIMLIVTYFDCITFHSSMLILNKIPADYVLKCLNACRHALLLFEFLMRKKLMFVCNMTLGISVINLYRFLYYFDTVNIKNSLPCNLTLLVNESICTKLVMT